MTTLFRYIPQIEQLGLDVDPQVLQLLAERDRQLEDFLSGLVGAEQMYSHAGTPVDDDESGPWYPKVGGSRLRVTVAALTAGSTDTVVTVYVSGVSAGTVTLPDTDIVAVDTISVAVGGAVDGSGDYITVAATTVGTGVEDVTVDVEVLP